MDNSTEVSRTNFNFDRFEEVNRPLAQELLGIAHKTEVDNPDFRSNSRFPGGYGHDVANSIVFIPNHGVDAERQTGLGAKSQTERQELLVVAKKEFDRLGIVSSGQLSNYPQLHEAFVKFEQAQRLVKEFKITDRKQAEKFPEFAAEILAILPQQSPEVPG